MIKYENSSDTLQKINLFKEIEQPCFNALVNISEKRILKKYRYIYKPGEASSTIYFLLKEIGKELIKTIHYPGEMFGEDGLLESSSYEDYAQAMDKEVQVLAISTDELKRFLCENPSLSIRLSTRIY